jgi:NAD kinase
LEDFPFLKEADDNPLNVFINKDEEARKSIDLIVTLGGDGTILWASKQFHGNYSPPFVCFSLGSLGYLCEFEFDEKTLESTLALI